MHIKREDYGAVTILSFDEEDQLRDPEPLRDLILELGREDRQFLLIDLENIGYISSSVLGYLITSYQHLREKGGILKLLNVQPSVHSVLEITRIDRIIEIFNDRKTALNSFE